MLIFIETVSYLGHEIGSHTNIKQLQLYLGISNYYGRFVPNLSVELLLFYKFLKNEVDFK